VLVLRCTKKLLGVLPPGITAEGIVSDDPELGSWFVDAISVRRSKCLLATHSGTLYSVLIPHIRKPDLQNLPEVFLRHLSAAFQLETFAGDARRFFDNRVAPFVISSTNSRRVLGSMTDLKYQLQAFFEAQSEVGPFQFAAAGRVINRVPMSFLKYGDAADSMKWLVTHEPT
jgi:hypothetical protein